MKHFYLLLIFCFCATGWAGAQQETTLSTMRSLPQHTYTNPAFVPAQQFYLGLPGISSVSGHFSSNSLTYSNIIEERAEGDTISLSYSELKGVMKEKNWTGAGAQADILAAGFRANPRLYLRYRLSGKAYGRVMLPGSVLNLGSEAFSQQAGSTSMDMQGHGFLYIEHALGASYLVNPKLTVGLNAKYINGVSSFHTEVSTFNLTSIPSENVLRLDGGFLAYSSGLGLLEGSLLDTLAHAETRKLIRGNTGWGVDLGATYQLTPRLQLGLSILNLGAINWTNDAKEYRVNESSATFASLGETDWGSTNPNAEAFVDSLAEHFKADIKTVPKYRTPLPKQMYLSASYQLHRSIQATGVVFTEQFRGRIMPGFTAAIHKDFGRRVGTSLSYTAINGSYSSLGAGFSFRLTPFQIYVVTDNVLGALDYKNNNISNVRAGLNLLFGTIKKPTKLPY